LILILFLLKTRYPGTVRKRYSDGTVFVVFDDGDEEDAAVQELRKLIPSSKSRDISRSYIAKAMSESLSYILTLEEQNVCKDGNGDDENKQCLSPENKNQQDEFREFHELADGTVFFFVWSGGNVMVLWDGRKHVDVNLFTYNEDEGIHASFIDHFKTPIPFMKTILHDPQPRGIRVINFEDDMYEDDSENISRPHWA